MTLDVAAKVAERRALPVETEWVEFKQNYLGPAEHKDVGEYVSAIANALVLCDRQAGYTVWGVADGTHALVGTDLRPRRVKQGNEELENWPTHNLDPQVGLQWHEADPGDGLHVVVLEIGAATDAPVRFLNAEFVRVGSLKKPLAPQEHDGEGTRNATANVHRERPPRRGGLSPGNLPTPGARRGRETNVRCGTSGATDPVRRRPRLNPRCDSGPARRAGRRSRARPRTWPWC